MVKIEGYEFYNGAAGSAQPIRVSKATPAQQAFIGGWLLHIPGQPIFKHYLLSCVHLRPVEGVTPAVKTFPTNTHEYLLAALDSSHDPDPNDPNTLVVLMPPNYVYQTELLDDEEADSVLQKLAGRFIDGYLYPDPSGIVGMREVFGQTVEYLKDRYRLRYPQG